MPKFFSRKSSSEIDGADIKVLKVYRGFIER